MATPDSRAPDTIRAVASSVESPHGVYMKIVRFEEIDSGTISFGMIDGDIVRRATGDLTSGFTPGEVAGDLTSLKLLAPVEPGKIVCVGLNYAAHVTERDPNRKVPDEPVIFMKPTSA